MHIVEVSLAQIDDVWDGNLFDGDAAIEQRGNGKRMEVLRSDGRLGLLRDVPPDFAQHNLVDLTGALRYRPRGNGRLVQVHHHVEARRFRLLRLVVGLLHLDESREEYCDAYDKVFERANMTMKK